MNPADEAQIEAAKFNAEMARRDAGLLMTSAAEHARMFTGKGEQLLAQSIAILGKTGGLGTKKGEPLAQGTALGARETEELGEYRAELEKKIKDLTEALEAGQPKKIAKNLEADIESAQKTLAGLGVEGVDVETADIRTPEAMLYASGSDLLTIVNTRDALERDKRTLMRGAQSEAIAMLKAGEQYETQAAHAKEAATWNTWQTILSGGLKIAGLFF